MSNINFPKSVTKRRRTTPSTVIGIIPNDAYHLGKTIAAINKDIEERVNYRLFARGLEAHSGGGKADALQLDTREFQIVEIVNGVNDSVKLPKAQPNLFMTIVNTNVDDIEVFSLGTDTLNGNTLTGEIVAGNSSIRVLAISGSEWITV